MPKGRHRHCFAPGCRTGYAGITAEKKLSLFSVPKDEARRKLWQKSLHRSDKPLDDKCAVCELHFEDHYILRDYVHVVDGKEVRIPRGVPTLTSDAVPTILPNAPKYLSTRAPPKRASRKREASAKLGSPSCKKRKGEDPDANTPTQGEHGSGGDESPNYIDVEKLQHLKTPSASWSVHQFPIFEGAVYALSDLEAGTGTVTSERTVLFGVSTTQEVTFKTFLIGKMVAEGAVMTVPEAERVLLRASEFLKCPGAMCSSAMLKEDLTNKLLSNITVVQSDFYNRRCVGMTATRGAPCLPCRYLRKALLTRISRLKHQHHRQVASAAQKLRSALQKHRRLSRKVLSLKGQIESMKARNAAMKEETLMEKIATLPQKQQESVRHCFAASRRKSTRGMHFTNEWVLECILMKMKSPKLYRHIRTHGILVLPSNTTLKKYTSAYKSGFGFSKKILETLKEKTSTMKTFRCHGGILIDEIKLSEHLSIEKSGKLQGFVDLGPFTQPKDANLPCDHGMVVMFVPFAGKFSQILGVFAAHGNVKGELLSKILVEATILAEQAGLFVDFVTCDGASWNRKMWKLMGIQGTATKVTCKVEHPVDPKRFLHFLSDFPHLVKCLRNSLLKGGFNTPSGRVSTYYVREAFNHDKDNITLKAMPGLTASHLDPNGFEKMRVSLAFQLFGDRVLRGLHHYKDIIESSYGKGALDGTELFFRMMNELIKLMTSRFKSGALWPNSTGPASLTSFLEYITKWEQNTKNGVGFISKSTATGFRVTLTSVLALLEYVTKELGYRYLMTCRLSQDPIENLFGIVRQSSGCNDHPTPEQFLITVNCLSFYSLAKPVQGASVEPLVLTALLDTRDACSSQSTSLQQTVDTYISRGDIDGLMSAACQDSDSFSDEHSSLVKKKSDARLVYHMAGYVARKCVGKSGCNTCRVLLLVPASEGQTDMYSGFTGFCDRGGLMYPSKELFDFINYLEDIFTDCFSTSRLHANSILDVLALVWVKEKTLGCIDHEADIKSSIVKFYVVTRLHFLIKGINKSKEERRKMVQHLKARRCT